MILLRVPGCVLLGMNERNLEHPELRFRGEEDWVLRSEADFERAISAPLGGNAATATGGESEETDPAVAAAAEGATAPQEIRDSLDSGSGGSGGVRSATPARKHRQRVAAEFLARIRCYCGKVAAILALRREDCVYESSLLQFDAYGPALESLASWEFSLDRSRTDGSQRSYHVIRVHSRVVRSNSSSGVSILAVRLVPSKQLRFVVTGSGGGAASGVEPERLAGRLELVDGGGPESGRVLVRFDGRAIDRKRYTVYRFLEKHLQDLETAGVDAPEFVLSRLERAAQAIREATQEDYPVEDVLATICEDGDIRQGIAQTKARLWDAPTVAVVARRLLDRMTTQNTLVDAGLPVAVQADLAQLQLPLSYHQRADVMWAGPATAAASSSPAMPTVGLSHAALSTNSR